MMRSQNNLLRWAVFLFLAWTTVPLRTVEAREVALPITLDYPLLTAMVTRSFFSGPGHKAVLVNEEDGCRQVVLSNPVFQRSDSRLLFEVNVFIRLGTTVLGSCLAPVEWEGYLVMEQDPMISPKWELSFATRTSSIYDRERRPAMIAGLVWKFANPPILAYLRKISLSLSAPVSDIQSFLLPLFPPEGAARADRFLKSMRPGQPQATASALQVPILAEVEVKPPERKRETITPQEREHIIDAWEAYDAFLVQAMTVLAQKALTRPERDIFLDTLLQMRYRFVQDLDEEAPEGDVVRQEFVRAWSRLSPVFRSHLIEGSNTTLLGYLAFFAGSDALAALDAVGPGVGIEISRAGLIRLTRYLVQQPVSLVYSYALDQTLRDTLGLGPPPVAPYGPDESPDPDDLRLPPGDSDHEDRWVRNKVMGPKRWAGLFQEAVLPTAWAAEGEGRKWSERVRPWLVPPKKDLAPYLERVRGLLASSSRQVAAGDGASDIRPDFFETLVMATAWQESCFRQFVSKNGVITYLRSYNGSSVGIMQINERVWRGMYAENSLRWDIQYNAAAGCEILRLYLMRYAISRMTSQVGGEARWDHMLALAVYAMYNAGPGTLNAFLKRAQQKAFTPLERLFMDKFEWVQQEDWEKIDRCF